MGSLLETELRNEVNQVLYSYFDSIKLLKADYVGYREFHEDGSSIAFCSNDAWYEVVLDEEMKEDMSIHYAQELMSINRNNFNYIIRTASCANNRFLRELLIRDMCNSLVIYRKEKSVIKLYSFIANNSNIAALNYFFNKRQLFELMVNSYKDELTSIFQKEKYLPLRNSLFSAKVVDNIFNQIENKASKVIHHYLTPREEKCISLLANGATNKDLAAEFNISTRTAQYHVNNIKKKLKVSSRCNILKSVKIQFNELEVL